MSQTPTTRKQCYQKTADELHSSNEPESLGQPNSNTQSSPKTGTVPSAHLDIEKGQVRQRESSAPGRRSLYERAFTWWAPSKITDGRYDGFKPFERELLHTIALQRLKNAK